MIPDSISETLLFAGKQVGLCGAGLKLLQLMTIFWTVVVKSIEGLYAVLNKAEGHLQAQGLVILFCHCRDPGKPFIHMQEEIHLVVSFHLSSYQLDNHVISTIMQL